MQSYVKDAKGEELRARFFSIVQQSLLSMAAQQPVIAMIDDLHWADTSCVELLASLLPLVKEARLSFILVSRSRQTPRSLWHKLAPVLQQCQEQVVEVRLEALSAEASRTLMQRLLGGDYLPKPWPRKFSTNRKAILSFSKRSFVLSSKAAAWPWTMASGP